MLTYSQQHSGPRMLNPAGFFLLGLKFSTANVLFYCWVFTGYLSSTGFLSGGTGFYILVTTSSRSSTTSKLIPNTMYIHPCVVSYPYGGSLRLHWDDVWPLIEFLSAWDPRISFLKCRAFWSRHRSAGNRLDSMGSGPQCEFYNPKRGSARQSKCKKLQFKIMYIIQFKIM